MQVCILITRQLTWGLAWDLSRSRMVPLGLPKKSGRNPNPLSGRLTPQREVEAFQHVFFDRSSPPLDARLFDSLQPCARTQPCVSVWPRSRPAASVRPRPAESTSIESLGPTASIDRLIRAALVVGRSLCSTLITPLPAHRFPRHTLHPLTNPSPPCTP